MQGRIKRAERKPRLVFPLIGKVKIGEKNSKGYPTALDYFKPSGKYANYFTEAYGPKPSTIQVIFLEDDPSLVCDERIELRDSAGKLVAYGDGIDLKVFNPKSERYEDYSVKDYPDLLEKLSKKHNAEWKTRLTLRFLLPKISGIVGHWELSTGGLNSSIIQITDVFDEVLKEKGFIKGIIFDLNVEIHVSNKPNSRSRFPVLSLVPNHSKENIEIIKTHVGIGFEPNL